MLKESDISELINTSGRLRMLSHRAGMFIALLMNNKQTDGWFLEELPNTIKSFENNYQSLYDKLASDEAILNALLKFKATTEVQNQSLESIVKQFIASAHKVQTALKFGQPISIDELSRFLRYISETLLEALNLIVGFFEQRLNMLSNIRINKINELANGIEESLEEVDKINLSIKILSFNASVEAARAGEMGAGFKVVANEMNRLNAMTKEVTHGVNKSVGSFIEEINI